MRALFNRPDRSERPERPGPPDGSAEHRQPDQPDQGGLATAVLDAVAARVARPGWDIAADLTPPEVVGARELTVLRRGLLAGLVAMLVLCAAGWVLAVRQHSGAEDSLAAEQSRTASLRAESQEYAVVTTLEGTTRSLDTQVATLMAGDVDVVTLLQRVHGSLPPGMTVTTETITVAQAGAAAPPTDGTTGTTGATGTSIGTVTLAGEGRRIEDLATLVDRLEELPGVSDVVPTSNTRSGSGVQYAATFQLTEDARSHRFDQGDRT